MAHQICSRNRLLINGFRLSLMTAVVMSVSAGSEAKPIESDHKRSMTLKPTGRGLDARLWRSEFGSRDSDNEGQKKPVFEEKPVTGKEASDTDRASSEKKIASELPLRHDSKAPIKQQQEPALQIENPGQPDAAPASAKTNRRQSLRRAGTEENSVSEETDELSPPETDSGTIDKKQKAMESMVERAGLSSGQTRELSDVAALEKLSPTETVKIEPSRSKPEGDAIMVPELSLEAVTTAVTMNDVNSSESVQTDEVNETDGSAVQVSVVTVSDWDRAAADSMRSGSSTGVKGPSLTTYLVGIAALIVVGGAVLSPR